MITCTNCLEALYPYVDRELSDEDIVQVQIHLQACPGCEHLYRFEQVLRRLVRVRCRETRAPDGLRERIVQRLAEEESRRKGQQRAATAE